MLPTSQSLLARARQSADVSAWTELHALYHPLIQSWLKRLSAPVSNIDDLTQDVLMVVMRNLSDFEHNQRTGAFRNWLRCVTVNCLRDFRKQNRLQPRSDGGTQFSQTLAELEDSDSPLGEQWNREHDQFVVDSVLRQIKNDFEPQSWAAFEMLTLQEMSADEVARQLNMNRNAVYAVKSRVMTRLRQLSAGLID